MGGWAYISTSDFSVQVQVIGNKAKSHRSMENFIVMEVSPLRNLTFMCFSLFASKSKL